MTLMESFAAVDQWIDQVALERRALLASYRNDVEAFLATAPAQEVESLRTRNLDAWKSLEAMPLERLQTLAENFRAYREVCEKEMFRDNQVTGVQLTWRFLRRLGLTPPSNMMTLLRESDVIEIYDLNLNQIFRNLNFFKVSSYSFEDLMHNPLAELFSRPAHINEVLFSEVQKVFSGRSREAFLSAVPEHEAIELHSLRRFHAKMQQRVISPLYNDTGHVLAILASVDVTVSNPRLLSLGSLEPRRSPVFA